MRYREVGFLFKSLFPIAVPSFVMQPSSSDTGFFQEAPVLLNQFHDDVAFRRAFKRKYTTHIARLLHNQRT